MPRSRADVGVTMVNTEMAERLGKAGELDAIRPLIAQLRRIHAGFQSRATD